MVAVPHLSGRVFPSTASTRTWLTDAGDLPPLLRGDRATVSEHGVPVLDTSDVNDRKRLSDKISEHKRRLEQRRVDEERRLLYVALTRAEDTLLLSGHHWGASEAKPRGPSDFLCELKDIIEQSDRAAGDPCGVVEHWAPAPADGEPNPLRDRRSRSALARRPRRRAPRRRGPRRGAGDAGDVGRSRRERPTMSTAGPPTSTRCWPSATVRAARGRRRRCPRAAVGQHPGRTRPRPRRGRATAAPSAAHPARPACPAGHRISRLGAAVLPRRAAVRPRRPARRRRPRRRRGREELAELQAAFAVSPWAARTPIDVEVPFDMVIGGARGAGPHRRDLRRRRRRRHGGGLEDRRSARHARSQAARGDSARGVPAGVGGDCTAAQSSRCARRSTTCGHGRTVSPDTLPGADDLRRAAGRGLGVAVDLQRRGDHRDLQRQAGDRAQPHGQRLVPPQPHHVDVGRKHRRRTRRPPTARQACGCAATAAAHRSPAPPPRRHRCRTAGCPAVRRGRSCRTAWEPRKCATPEPSRSAAQAVGGCRAGDLLQFG